MSNFANIAHFQNPAFCICFQSGWQFFLKSGNYLFLLPVCEFCLFLWEILFSSTLAAQVVAYLPVTLFSCRDFPLGIALLLSCAGRGTKKAPTNISLNILTSKPCLFLCHFLKAKLIACYFPSDVWYRETYLPLL